MSLDPVASLANRLKIQRCARHRGPDRRIYADRRRADGGGYQVAWKNGGADEYIVWNLDGSGNWLSQGSVLSGASPELKSFENTFQQDLNLNGVVGAIRR